MTPPHGPTMPAKAQRTLRCPKLPRSVVQYPAYLLYNAQSSKSIIFLFFFRTRRDESARDMHKNIQKPTAGNRYVRIEARRSSGALIFQQSDSGPPSPQSENR